MQRFNRLYATVQTLPASLESNERIILAQVGVGLYDGKVQDPSHTNGVMHLTNYRLIYIDALKSSSNSTALSLSNVRGTEYWIGMFSSSPKITLLLGDAETIISENGKGKEEGEEGGGGERNWVCRVCGMSNGIAGGTIGKCGLCGVIRQSSNNKIVPKSVATTPIDNLSLPPSRTATPTPTFATSTPIAIPTTAPIIDNEKRIVCPVCTFLNHRSMAACEVCDTSLGSNSPVPRPISASSSSSIGGGSAINDSVKLSFRKGGEKAFYTALKLVLIQKEWEKRLEAGDNLVKPKARKVAAGIDAILRGIETEVTQRGDEMEDALQDLNALMAKAKEMILLAQSINERLSVQEAASSNPNTSSSETTLIRTSLLNLGLPTPAVTADMMKDEVKYHEELAKELGEVLSRKGGVMEKGMVGLDEAWCVWNRARGVALVSPKDLKLAAPHLPKFTSPRIRLRIFPKSGLPILHTPDFSQQSFSRRVLSLLDLRQALCASFMTAFDIDRISAEREGVTTLELARIEEISVGLVEEMMDDLEGNGTITRDEQGGEGVRWYRNFISSFQWEDLN